MPDRTPFHARTARLCKSMLWKDWAGYHAVRSYALHHEPEYFAIRHSAGLIDVSPLFKYEVRGADAGRFLARLMVRNIARLKRGRVTYLCWCDDAGKVIDDGTVARLGKHHFRVTSAEPALAWLERHCRGYQVEIEDSSRRFGALALQGPRSRDILRPVVDTDVDKLGFFRLARCKLAGTPIWLTRTGYTGDLGYEVWVEAADAERVYDALLEAGEPHAMLPAGLDAMDVTRIEAGFILNGVDYYSARHCLTEERKSSPYELGLGWTVKLRRAPFVGQRALERDAASGPTRKLVGLDIDWEELEAVFDGYGLPPELPAAAWRDGRPVYDENGRWIGQATSGAWSPTLKKNLALAQLQAPAAVEGSRVKIEITAEYHRHAIHATVTKPQFFDPPRKKA